MSDLRTQIAESRSELAAAQARVTFCVAAIRERSIQWEQLQPRIAHYTRENDLEKLKDALIEQEALNRILRSLQEDQTRLLRERERADQRYNEVSQALTKWRREVDATAASLQPTGNLSQEIEKAKRELERQEQHCRDLEQVRVQYQERLASDLATLAAIQADAREAQQESSQ